MENQLDFGRIGGLATVALPLNFGVSMSSVTKKNLCVADLWDGVDLKISFRRGVNETLMQDWFTLVAIAESITYSDDCDAIIWSFDNSSKFSVQSMYSTISFRGIQPVYTPVIWNLYVPPRVHIFLWLISNNKALTRSNLAKRKNIEDTSCLFCSDFETIHHLFFDCCVASTLWKHVSDIFGVQIGSNFESVARWWVSNKRNCVLNTVGAALLWNLWKLRNEICFLGKLWKDERVALNKIAQALKSWRPLYKAGHEEEYNRAINRIAEKSLQPLRLTARSSESVTLPSSTSAPPSSESEALNLASGVMVDISFSVRSCAV